MCVVCVCVRGFCCFVLFVCGVSVSGWSCVRVMVCVCRVCGCVLGVCGV